MTDEAREAAAPEDGAGAPERDRTTVPRAAPDQLVRERRRDLLVAAALAVGTVLLYAQVAHHPFVFYDDGTYVFENPRVRAGLSWSNVAWALTTLHFDNWHPLTWLSYMLDVQLFGVSPGALHLVNALLHAANAAVLFLVLGRMTGARWRSAFVAAAFAVHPLHVESVAWIAERKDVLGTFFGLLALWAWRRYAERPAAGRYALVALWLALSLMAKPMLVTLPALLLLLDAWPLGRIAGLSRSPAAAGPPPVPLRRAILEKVPLLAMVAASSLVTVIAQRRGGALQGLELGLGARLANAAVSYVQYVIATLWPVRLAVFYPHPGAFPAWKVAGAALLLAAATIAAASRVRALPWLAVGWLWFLGTLVPAIGIVQVGSQAMADRYTYFPAIGLFVAIAWGAERVAGRMAGGLLLRAGAVIALAALSALAWRQIGTWADHETLFRHAIAVTDRNARAHAVLAQGLRRAGRLAEALAEAEESARLEPESARHWTNVSQLRRELRRPAEAVEAAERAARLQPGFGAAWVALADAEADLGRLELASSTLQEAVRAAPSDASVWHRLGVMARRSEQPEAALDAFRRAVGLDPQHVAAWSDLAILYQALGRTDDAAGAFEAAARAQPENPVTWRNLGLSLAMSGRLPDAADAFERALQLSPGDADLLHRLAVVQLAQGARDAALETAARLEAIDPGAAADVRLRAGAR